MSDEKNIEKLLSHLPDQELPAGYDQRFFAKMDHENNRKHFSLFHIPMPMQIGLGATFASIALVVFSIIKVRSENGRDDVAVNDEIDLLENLDMLEEWSDENS